MFTETLIDLCSLRIPSAVEWHRSTGEPYGAHNIPDNHWTNKALYCVTPTRDVVSYFREGGYDLLISHHPFYVADDIPHLIYHTALDCCKGGLNDMWRDALGLQNAFHFDETLGWTGRIEPTPFGELVEKCRAFAGDIIGQVYCDTDKLIESVAICTGLGGVVAQEAAATGADCYILGENTVAADETGFRAVVEVGHTLSERVGVNLFREILNPHRVRVDCAPIELDRYGKEVYRPQLRPMVRGR